MRWGIGILTWNAPAVCWRTVVELHANLTWTVSDQTLVLDNGSDVPVTLPRDCVERHPTNLIQAQLGHRNLATTSRDLDHIASVELIESMQQRVWKFEGSRGN